MDEKKIYGGLGALAFVILLIGLFMPRDTGPSVGSIVAKELAPVQEAVAALESRIDGVEGTLGGMTEQLAAAVLPEDLAAVAEQVDAAKAETAALGASLADMQGSLSDAVSAMAAAPAAAPAPATATASAPQAAPAASADTEVAFIDGPDGLKPGQTAVFADGALRLFVSRLEPADKRMHVSVMGEMKTLQLGQGRTLAAGDDFCRVTVSDLSDNGAVMDAVCGADLPAPEGIAVGETAIFNDGALRVFASLVGETDARLSVNGALHHLAIGRSVPVAAGEESCRVYLDAVDRGHSSVSALCGDAVTVSDIIGPGSTVVLGDGAARVFVASVASDEVRFAVNGQTLTTAGSGGGLTLADGCAVVVEDIDGSKASFSYACDP